MPNVKKKNSQSLSRQIIHRPFAQNTKLIKKQRGLKYIYQEITYSWSSGIVFMAYRMPRAENENKKTNVSISSEASCRIQRKAAKTRHLSVNVISPSAVAAAIM